MLINLCKRAIASVAAMSPLLTSEKLFLSYQSCMANISVKQEENRPLAIIDWPTKLHPQRIPGISCRTYPIFVIFILLESGF